MRTHAPPGLEGDTTSSASEGRACPSPSRVAGVDAIVWTGDSRERTRPAARDRRRFPGTAVMSSRPSAAPDRRGRSPARGGPLSREAFRIRELLDAIARARARIGRFQPSLRDETAPRPPTRQAADRDDELSGARRSGGARSLRIGLSASPPPRAAEPQPLPSDRRPQGTQITPHGQNRQGKRGLGRRRLCDGGPGLTVVAASLVLLLSSLSAWAGEQTARSVCGWRSTLGQSRGRHSAMGREGDFARSVHPRKDGQDHVRRRRVSGSERLSS
jgi:hypothetical protein